MAPTTVTVLYPPTNTFNMKYYLETHMPLVQKIWGPAGLKSWAVTKLSDDQSYSVQAVLQWESAEAYEAAGKGEGGKEIIGDIKNFTSTTPVFLSGELVGSSS